MGLSGVSSASWWKAILAKINAPDTDNNKSNLSAWQACEGGSASFNPFNTTLPWPNATLYNSAGVRNYATFDDGVGATTSTMLQSNMAAIVTALRNNADRGTFANAVGSSPWGTSGDCIAHASGAPSGG